MPEHEPKGRLYHAVPAWVPDGSVFHVRVRSHGTVLTEASLAENLLRSVALYHDARRWHCQLFVLMPDHWHALLSFPRVPGMSDTIRAWKSYHARQHGVLWQDGYFDHRLRNGEELESKRHYIEANPLVKGFCASPADWPFRWPRSPQ